MNSKNLCKKSVGHLFNRILIMSGLRLHRLRRDFFSLQVYGGSWIDVDVFSKTLRNGYVIGWSSPVFGNLKICDSYSATIGISVLASAENEPTIYPPLTDNQAAIVLVKAYNKVLQLGFKSFHIAFVAQTTTGNDLCWAYFNIVLGIFDKLNQLSTISINDQRSDVFYGVAKVPKVNLLDIYSR